MKTSVVLLAILASAISPFTIYGKDGKVTVLVVDENDNPVPNIEVSAGFDNVSGGGGGAGGGAPTEAKALTGKDGICVLTGNGSAPSVGIGIRTTASYYGAGGNGVRFTNSSFGRWQPWNPTVKVVLQKVGTQVPMFAKMASDIKIPKEGQPVGYDLMSGDWVAPFGKGKTADMIFEYNRAPTKTLTNWWGTSPRPFQTYDNRLTIRFANDGDGIQFAAATGHGLRLPRMAPADGYQPLLTKRLALEEIKDSADTGEKSPYQAPKTKTYSDFRTDANYFFRVRTLKDEQGNITNALYGKIYGEFKLAWFPSESIGFTYYLNPVPNDRNMEFNTRSNLFKNLKSLEQVTAP